jgi:hypothetical protein
VVTRGPRAETAAEAGEGAAISLLLAERLGGEPGSAVLGPSRRVPFGPHSRRAAVVGGRGLGGRRLSCGRGAPDPSVPAGRRGRSAARLGNDGAWLPARGTGLRGCLGSLSRPPWRKRPSPSHLITWRSTRPARASSSGRCKFLEIFKGFLVF